MISTKTDFENSPIRPAGGWGGAPFSFVCLFGGGGAQAVVAWRRDSENK